MQAAKYWRNKKLRYRLIMMGRNGGGRALAQATGRSQMQGERPSGEKRIKVHA